MKKSEIYAVAREILFTDFCVPRNSQEKLTIIPKNSYIPHSICGATDTRFKALCFEGNLHIVCASDLYEDIFTFAEKKSPEWFFEFDNIFALEKVLAKHNMRIADAHHFYLPKGDTLPCPNTEFDVLFPPDFEKFKGNYDFTEALAFDPDKPDMLALVAKEGDNVIAMAGASRDSEKMYQIGINVLPQYRGKGLAAKLVTALKDELLSRNIIPFYGTVESHIFSQNVAINSGFRPAWAQLYAESL